MVRIAFQSAKDADGDEHDYVNRLRESNNYIPELALVTRDGAKIIGQIILTRMYIHGKEVEFEALLLSPVCVLMEYRNNGIGSKLIIHSLELAKSMGYKAVFLVGEPDYYSRFGFRTIEHFKIRDTGNIPVQYTMALELEAGYLNIAGGVISIC